MGQGDVSRALKDLHQLGLVRVLLPKSRKRKGGFQRGNSYQGLYILDAPLPSDREIDIG